MVRMQRMKHGLILVLLAAACAGCSGRGVYEGLAQQETLRNPQPPGQPAPRRPGYDEYETERKRPSP